MKETLHKCLLNVKDSFPKIHKNPYYRAWYFTYALLATLAIFFVYVSEHTIIYYFPFNWFGLIVGLILPWVVGTCYIIYQGVDHAHQFMSTKIVLSCLLLPVILVGFLPNEDKGVNYTDKHMTTIFNPAIRKQTIQATPISHTFANYFTNQEHVAPYNDKKDGEIYVFYHVQCEYCHKAIPVLTDGLSESEQKQVTFVDISQKESQHLARAMGVEKAGTAVVYRKDKETGGWSRRIERLARGKRSNPRLDKAAIEYVWNTAKTLDKVSH